MITACLFFLLLRGCLERTVCAFKEAGLPHRKRLLHSPYLSCPCLHHVHHYYHQHHRYLPSLARGVNIMNMRWIFTTVFITPAFGFTTCASFVLTTNSRLWHLQAKQEGNTHKWNHKPFDFSSRIGWDNFYKEGNQSDDEQILENMEYEWHSHIPHSIIVDAIAPTIVAASKYYMQINANELPSILLVGTGNSALPRILHDAFDIPVRVTCLDYSPVCVEMIRSMYSDLCPNMDFVLGDATRLQETVDNEQYDVIVDKGLLDALMCGEGFDSDLKKLMGGIDAVLTRREWGIYVLVCFQLSKSNREFFTELTDRGESHNPNLFWDFDIPVEGSENGRATFNLATRCALNDKNRIVNVDGMMTDWK